MNRTVLAGRTPLLARPHAIHSSGLRSSTVVRTHSTLPPLQILPEVQKALSDGKPVVALESTILSHGLVYPQNYETALAVSQVIRKENAIPATIAVANGECRVGLSVEELHDLSRAGQEGRARKISTRELPWILSETRSPDEGIVWGGTTVASTMKLAHLAGISTFVTGGTGGVHRGAEVSMDISADLTELSRTPVVVVSAGIKSILDVAKTLEMLETLSVSVATWQSDDFPAFFSPTSGLPTPWRVETAEQVARAFGKARQLHLSSGMLVAVPPTDTVENGARVENAIQQALRDATERGIAGQDVTPFVLEQVSQSTRGESMASNISLIQQNAQVGAQIAVAIAKQQQRQASPPTTTPLTLEDSTTPKSSENNNNNNKKNNHNSDDTEKRPSIVVMGGALLDIIAKPTNELLLSTSNPGQSWQSDGGVGRNIAQVLSQLARGGGGCDTYFYTVVGNDALGREYQARLCAQNFVDAPETITRVEGQSTATYIALHESKNGDLHAAIADTQIFAALPMPSPEVLRKAQFVVLDANPPLDILLEASQRAVEAHALVCLDPTSVPKAAMVGRSPDLLSHLSYLFPNLDELVALAGPLQRRGHSKGSFTEAPIDSLPEHLWKVVQENTACILPQMKPDKPAFLIVTLGAHGVVVASRGRQQDDDLHSVEMKWQHFPALTQGVVVRNSNGAGDTLCGAFLHALWQGASVKDAVERGIRAATQTLLLDEEAVAPHLE